MDDAINHISCFLILFFNVTILCTFLRSFFRPDHEPIDLQLDYWTADASSNPNNPDYSQKELKRGIDHSSSRSDSKRDFGIRSSNSENMGGGKASIKTSVWFMKVMKLGLISDQQPTFTMHYWLKEKKQKSK